VPNTETVVKAFLASPGDLQSERDIVAEVVASLNSAWTKTEKLRLELLRWETDIAPGIGSDAQDVVNRQIGEDYDIFLAIFWKTLGTPTDRAPSGSVEEFRRARDRFLQKAVPAILIYFKTAAVPIDDIDPDQIHLVRQFRGELKRLGVLYQSFETLDQFKELLRLHLSLAVHDIKASLSEAEVVSRATPPSIGNMTELDEVHEDGFLDLVVRGTESFEKVSEVSKQAVTRVIHFTEMLKQATQAINSLGPLTNAATVREAKRIVDSSADDLDIFASEIEGQTPIFSTVYVRAVESYGSAAALLSDFKTVDRKQLEEARMVIGSLKQNLGVMQVAVTGLRATIESWPPVTAKLNQAKRRTVVALNEFYSATAIAADLTSATEAMVEGLLRQAQPDPSEPPNGQAS
jgi:hypothetical protein